MNSPNSPNEDLEMKEGEEDDSIKSNRSARSNTTEEGVEQESRGVRGMIILKKRIKGNQTFLWILYSSFALISYALSLDQYTNNTYLTTATSTSFDAHSTLATLATVKALFQSISQPPIAALSQWIGRKECYLILVLLYVLGYIVVASANNVTIYAIGSAINVLGITGMFLLQSIIIADVSSTRNRLFWTIFPSLPSSLNVWLAGNVASAVLRNSTWRWGIGMFCLLTPVLSIPIISVLHFGMQESPSARKAPKKIDPVAKSKLPIAERIYKQVQQLDLVGIIFLIVGMGCLLIAATLGNTIGWGNGEIIALLVVGSFFSISFVLFERFYATNPLLPFSLLTNRTVISCLLVSIFHPAATAIANGFFYTFLVVVLDQSVLSATRLVDIPAFVGIIVAVLTGVLVRYTRRLKPIIIGGLCLEILGLGLMIRYREQNTSQIQIGAIQSIRGAAIGCISFPILAAIQSATPAKHIAAITSGYLTIFYLSGSIGSAIGGAIWSDQVPKLLSRSFDSALATTAYENPLDFIVTYAPGTFERSAINLAQTEAQKLIIIVATCFAAIALFFAFGLENIILTDSQSLEEDENGSDKVKIDKV